MTPLTGKHFIVLALVSCNFLWLLSLPALSVTGLWFQTEPVVAMRYLLCAILAVALAWYSFHETAAKCSPLGNPLSVVFLLFSAIGAIGLAAAPLPGLSVFGSVELGEGIAGFACLSILVTAATTIRRLRISRRIVGVTAATSIIAVLALLEIDVPDWVPFYFKDFIGSASVYFIVISLTWVGVTKRRFRPIVFVLGLAIALLSENRASILAIILFFMVLYVFSKMARRDVSTSTLRYQAAVLAVAAPIVTTLLIVFTGLQTDLQSDNARYWDAISTRGLLTQVVFDYLSDDPGAWLFGTGWGHYTELLIQYLPRDSLTLHPLSSSGQFFWDSLWRADFHSHNQMIEALASAGLPGAILWLSLLVLIPFTARRRYVPLAAAFSVFVGVYFSFWFEMPTNTPFFALSIAGLTAQRTKVFHKRPAIHRGLLVLISIALAGVAFASYSLAAAARKEAQINMNPTLSPTSSPCAPFFEDFGRGGRHLSWLMRSYVNGTIDKAKSDKPISELELERIGRFLCRLDRERAAGSSLRVLTDLLNVRADLAFMPENALAEKNREALVFRWGVNLQEFLTRAPARTDLAAPYFHWLFLKGKEREILAFSSDIVDKRPDDPVGLWFSGLVMLGDPGTAGEGHVRMIKALDNGIQKVFPIENNIIEQLRDKGATISN